MKQEPSLFWLNYATVFLEDWKQMASSGQAFNSLNYGCAEGKVDEFELSLTGTHYSCPSGCLVPWHNDTFMWKKEAGGWSEMFCRNKSMRHVCCGDWLWYRLWLFWEGLLQPGRTAECWVRSKVLCRRACYKTNADIPVLFVRWGTVHARLVAVLQKHSWGKLGKERTLSCRKNSAKPWNSPAKRKNKTISNIPNAHKYKTCLLHIWFASFDCWVHVT